MAAVNLWLGSVYATGDPAGFAAEGGPIENLQAALISVAFLLFLSQAGSPAPAIRALALGLAFLAFAFFFREVDLRSAGVPDWLVRITSGTVRDAIFLVLVGLLLVYLTRHRRSWREIAGYALTRHATALWVCVLFLLAGDAVDKGIIRADPAKFWEETLEVEAYIALLFGAWRFRQLAGIPRRTS